MNTTMTPPLRLAGALLLAAGLAWLLQPAIALGAGSSSSTSEPTIADMIDDAEDRIDDGEYQDAIALLETARAEEPDNPDVLNWLGYSHRKLGDREKALEFYTAALAQEPDHLGANEYLGELYLEMDDLAKAEERLAVLATACDSDCEEYDDLAQEIAEYKETHGAS